MKTDRSNFRSSLNMLKQLARAEPPGSVFGLPGLVPPDVWANLPSHRALGRRFRQIADTHEFAWAGEDECGIALYLRK